MRGFERSGLDTISSSEDKAINFLAKAYPDQTRLVLAYVVEAFAELGCDLTTLQTLRLVKITKNML